MLKQFLAGVFVIVIGFSTVACGNASASPGPPSISPVSVIAAFIGGFAVAGLIFNLLRRRK
ncbi:hypothetical protein Dehly_1576 [Dehalogenimonas lykanthroporepellens BL-DC-9]|nr:hypothetical protein Dehly_1576 [Dehalogenimonas lykanthroporepellens BL-DC-9]